jgi:glycosyltransferase involved in cell wall biosynthesis
MKVLQVVHGYPPELLGGTERTVQELSRGLLRQGLDVTVMAGSLDWNPGTCLRESHDVEPQSGRRFAVWRLHRGDPFFDHWHKSRAPAARALFEELLGELQPEVVHVHHWQRLTRDLVASAARLGVPAVVSLHDLSVSCLIAFRVQPGTNVLCRAPLGPDPCLACAAKRPPFTPWVDPVEGRMRLFEHARDTLRELDLARVRVVPSASHLALLATCLGRTPEALTATVVPPGRSQRLPRWPGPAATGPLELCLFGHLTPIKGVHLALEAMRRLRDPRAVRLHLLGGEVDSTYSAQLRRQASGLDVHFHGPYRLDALAEHPARKSAALLSCSLGHESYGLVLDEALDLGLPWILPAAGAFAERAQGQAYASLYPPGESTALANLLQQLLTDPRRLAAMRSAVPSAGSGALDWDAHAAAMLPLYRQAIAAGAPAIAPRQWYEDRLEQHQNERWEAGLSAADFGQLGFDAPGLALPQPDPD